MSVESTNLLLGNGELFFKRHDDAGGKYVHVGSLKGTLNLIHEVEIAEQKPGNRLTVARRDKISESARFEVEVCDFRIGGLIAAFGLSISTSQLTATSTLKLWEEMAFGSTTTTKTLSRTAVSTSSVVVYSMDRSTKHVSGTDFTVPSTTKIVPLTAGFANLSQFVSYETADVSATRITIGDKTTLQVVDLKFTHKLSDGKFITLEMPRATVIGGVTIPFNETEHTVRTMTFAALGDMTKPAGSSLFSLIREA